MLAYFPSKYEDELLYSLIARYGIHTNQTNNHKAIIQDVFGKKTAAAVADLPSNLSTFCKQVRHIWSITDLKLINEHTLAPIYIPFLAEEKACDVIESMRSDYGGNIHTRVGINASNIALIEYFRYCPACVSEQEKTLGEAYWLRRHQLPCLEVCFEHQCKLVSSEIPFYPKQKHHYQAAEGISKSKLIKSVSLNECEKKLISSYYELLGLKFVEKLSYNQWTVFYQKLATDLGLVKGRRVDHNEIYQRIYNHWNNTLFEEYLPQKADENSWLLYIFRKHRKSFHPIRHLMVLSSFLKDESIGDILKEVSDLPKKIDYKTKEPSVTQKSNNEYVEQRSAWLDLCKKYPEIGVKALRKIRSGARLYAWLYRNDINWLRSNTLSAQRSNLKRYQKDYASWDKQNIVLLKLILKNIQLLKKRPRASKAYFMKQLPKSSSIEKHLIDLPETANWLKANQEDKLSYREFRLRVAMQTLGTANLPLIKWRLLRLASIRSEYVTDEIERYIENLIKEAKAAA